MMDVLDAERRAVGRQHTAHLLKMLRGGYGTTPVVEDVVPIAEVSPAKITETPPPAYVRLVAPPPVLDTSAVAPAHRPSMSAIPSVGESLRRHRGSLGEMLAHTDQLAESRRVFLAFLRPDLRDHALLIRLDENAWTVQTDSSVWATRLRYALHGIRQVLGLHFGITLPKPLIQITPPTTPPAAPQPRRRTLSQAAARCLEEIARHETDPHLSAALWQLARRAELSTPDHVPNPPKQSS